MARTKAVIAPGSGAASTLATQAYARLRQDLIDGRFPPGEKLRVHVLCRLYDVGVSPMREALNRASRDGLVQQTDLRGFSVAPLSIEDLADLTKVRCWLNELALRKSIAFGDERWEEGIVLAHHRLTRTPRRVPGVASRNPEWEAMHRAFHTNLIVGCGSQRLIDYCEQLFDSVTRYRQLWSHLGEEVEGFSDDAHKRLMDVTLARRADEAARLLVEHFERAANLACVRLRQAAAAE